MVDGPRRSAQQPGHLADYRGVTPRMGGAYGCVKNLIARVQRPLGQVRTIEVNLDGCL